MQSRYAHERPGWREALVKPLVLIALVVLLMVLPIVSCQPDPMGRFTAQAAATELEEFSGLQVPPGAKIVGFSTGWEERFMRLEVDAAQLQALLAQAQVQPVSVVSDSVTRPRAGRPGRWWDPSALKQPTAYEGDLHGIRNHSGRLFIVVDHQAGAPHTVYVYGFSV